MGEMSLERKIMAAVARADLAAERVLRALPRVLTALFFLALIILIAYRIRKR